MRHLPRHLGILVLAVLLVAGGAVASGLALTAHADGGTHAPGAGTAAPAANRPGDRWFRLASSGRAPLVPNEQDFAARTGSTGPLLLFLPATGQKPADYSRFLTAARGAGYHVLGLDYWNLGRTVASTCNHDAACYGAVQRNRFDGSHPVPQSDVAPRNSVVGRLVPALHYLQRQDPHGGWGAYLHGSSVQWNDVVVAGHSQGGGESAYIAHIRSVRGALLFGSPIVTDGRVAATWLSTPGRTPASRIYALDDARDGFFPRITASWARLGLGAPQRIAPSTTAFSGHALVETLSMQQAHLRIVNDDTPLTADGTPVFAPVWSWMLSRFI